MGPDLPALKLSARRHRQFVAAVVFRVPAVPGDASEFEVMRRDQLVELFPKVEVFDRAPFTEPIRLSAPTIGLPLGHPRH